MKHNFKQLMVKMSYMNINGRWDKQELKYDGVIIGSGLVIVALIYIFRNELMALVA